MRLFAALILAVTAIAAPNGASADDSSTNDRWQASVSAFLSLSGHNARSSVASNLRPPPPPPPPPAPGGGATLPTLGEEIHRTQTILLPALAGSLEILTPALFDAFGAPRLFAHGDVLPIFSPELKLAGEASPGPFRIPQNPAAPEESIGGQGSQTSWDPATLAFGAGLGVAFHFEYLDIEFALKPSAEWYSYNGTFRTFVSRALKVQGELTVDRLVQVRLTERRTFHAVGGGLELEAKIDETESFSTHMFVLARGYSVLGNRSIESSFFQAATPNPDQVLGRYKTSSFLYNFGIGFRLRWRGL